MNVTGIAKAFQKAIPLAGAGGKLRWAVVGAPSSGKTYLLSDLVQALGAMGYQQEKLPLTAQYSSLGLFFYDASNAKTGGIQQTEIYACRSENHYGGVFYHPKKMGKLEIDFLNIPGEVFASGNKRMDMFFELKECMARIKKDTLVVTRFVNPAGHEQLIIEPSPQVRAMLNLDSNPQPAAQEVTPAYRRQNYLRWDFLMAELSNQRYERKESKAVSGKYILEHFFDFNPDSVIQSIIDIWSKLTTKLDWYEYDANNILQFMYFMLYCSQATDIILCDKMTVPSQSSQSVGATQAGGYDFESLTKQLCNFIEHDSKRPNIYLAFRGADIVMKGKADHYAGLITKDMSKAQRRKVVYDAFMKDINDIMTSQQPSPTLQGTDGAVLTGMPLDQHILTRIGSNLGYGFWHLLNKTEPTGFIAKTMRSIKGTRSIQEIYSSPDRPVIPPHVYFTSTPIDIDMNIYDNDKDDVTVFTHEDNDGIRSFHIETACNGTESMCFGSYQLLDEIIKNNDSYL